MNNAAFNSSAFNGSSRSYFLPLLVFSELNLNSEANAKLDAFLIVSPEIKLTSNARFFLSLDLVSSDLVVFNSFATETFFVNAAADSVIAASTFSNATTLVNSSSNLAISFTDDARLIRVNAILGSSDLSFNASSSIFKELFLGSENSIEVDSSALAKSLMFNYSNAFIEIAAESESFVERRVTAFDGIDFYSSRMEAFLNIDKPSCFSFIVYYEHSQQNNFYFDSDKRQFLVPRRESFFIVSPSDRRFIIWC